ncbi:hypothetical protein SAMN04488001_0907 [Litoreibacter albidus]|uniref:Uncharacterized protein n=1 Tax=Litoreibacter albidus TaxID=670155 RepID=A0A1H2SR99_9RHOB|nr:hypothetical protein SAMN04488001_0907 [Litoreibacter albidus]
MNGYAIMGPAALGGPPGWALWAIGGTIITVGTVLLGNEVYQATRAEPRAEPRAPAVPTTDTCATGNCPRPYSVRVHAQGMDCGGTSGSTIGAPAFVSTTPIPAATAIGLSQATWAMLGRRQRSIRTQAKVRLERYVLARPPAGYLGEKTFAASDPSGGKRYDVDSYGSTPNFIA